MNILAIECTHASLSAAVSRDGNVSVVFGSEWNRAAETILPLVQQALERSGTSKEQLDAVAVSSGPGSFTALRIGMSAAKGVAYGLDIPLLPIPTLSAMAEAAFPFTSAAVIVPVIPSRKGEYYFTCYRREVLEEGVSEDESARGTIGDVVAAARGLGSDVVLVARRTVELESLSEAESVCILDADFFSAASILPEALRLAAEGGGVAPSEAEPDYRQKFEPGQA
ncbi:MAG: tRNA (adenosine(37)-N6)-threonylcarbamoyltransferase complex dimerization subunit type 1 TsaB [Chlorobiaceae bacterium]|jgi:tRNA threonylcarbamoyladenosine biosynthesis protein TsaB|nr:tRNA (adenosine(37)-N6)-threonylcarbamoyltransferase complex dimerization subunit type 1 TsaB [Chlorobiaceae bacterium]